MSAVLCPWRVHDEDIAWVRVARMLAPAIHAAERTIDTGTVESVLTSHYTCTTVHPSPRGNHPEGETGRQPRGAMDMTTYTISTLKGSYTSDVLRAVCAWQAKMQAGCATINGVDVDAIDFDSSDLDAAVAAVEARLDGEVGQVGTTTTNHRRMDKIDGGATPRSDKMWKFKVVKRARGMSGEWFDFPTASTFADEASARAYAEAFAKEQAGVCGAAIDVRRRGGIRGRGVTIASYNTYRVTAQGV